MHTLRTRTTGQEYLTLWWIGCITFLTAISITLFLHFTVFPVIERLNPPLFPGLGTSIPLSLQICFCFLLIAGLSAIVSLCRWRHAPLSLFFMGTLPLLIVFILYALPQSLFDLYWNPWEEAVSIYALQFAPQFLLVISYFSLGLSTIILLRKLWIGQRTLAK